MINIHHNYDAANFVYDLFGPCEPLFCLLYETHIQSLSTASIETPHEASQQIPLPPEMIPDSPRSSSNQGGGLFSWIGGSSLVNKVVEKTKASLLGI